MKPIRVYCTVCGCRFVGRVLVRDGFQALYPYSHKAPGQVVRCPGYLLPGTTRRKRQE